MPITWYLLAFILDFDSMINKASIIMLITGPLRIVLLSISVLAFTQNDKFNLPRVVDSSTKYSKLAKVP